MGSTGPDTIVVKEIEVKGPQVMFSIANWGVLDTSVTIALYISPV